MMVNLIDQDAAIAIAERYGCANGSALGRHSGVADCIAFELAKLPTVDAIEVVRCGVCKWRDQDNCPMEFYWDTHPLEKNAFCAYGEKDIKR